MTSRSPVKHSWLHHWANPAATKVMQWLTNFSAVSHTYLYINSTYSVTMYEQHESCTFTDTLLGFPEYIIMYKIKDHGSRIAAWLIPVYQETYITTRLHKKSLWACSSFEKMWVVNHKQNKVQWQYLRDGEKACLQDWRMDSSFLLFWKFPLFLG